MNSLQPASGNGEVARSSGARGQQHDVEGALEVAGRQIVADVHAGLEGHALLEHLLYTPVNHPFFKLEIGNAVAQDAARAVGPLEHDDRMAHTPQLLRRREAGRAGPDDGDLFSGFEARGPRLHPPLLESVLYDGAFDLLDGDRCAVDRKRAGGLAGRGADAAGDLGQVVGHFKP